MAGIFSDRLSMTLAYEAVMSNRHELLRDQQRLDYGQNLLKSYIVEVDASSRSPLEALRLLVPGGEGELTTTDDERLFGVHYCGANFMVDALSDRFFVFHSLDAADVADKAHQLLSHIRLADSTWFGSEFLRDLFSLGQPLGFSTAFDSSYFAKRSRPETRVALEPELRDELGKPADDDDARISGLAVRMSGRDAAFALQILESDDYLAAHLPIASAKVRYGALGNVDEVRFDGRVIARGPSFSDHSRMVERLVAPYSGWLNTTERDLAFGAVQEDGAVSLDGEPIVIPLGDVEFDVPRFTTRLLSGGKPFRFWGVPRSIGTDGYYVTAADLHGAGVLRLDITPRVLRVYLEKGTCANSVLRLFVNLQQMLSKNLPLQAAGEDISPRMSEATS